MGYTYKSSFLFAFVRSKENIKVSSSTNTARTLVNVHPPKIYVNTTGAPLEKDEMTFVVHEAFLTYFYANNIVDSKNILS